MIVDEIKEHFTGLCLFGLLILIMICGAFIWELNKKIEKLEKKEPVKIELKFGNEEEPQKEYEGEDL